MGNNSSNTAKDRPSEPARSQNENAVVQLQDTDDEDLIASAFAATDTVKPPSQPTDNSSSPRVVNVSNDQPAVSKKRQSLLQAGSTNKLSGAPMATDRPVRVTNQPFVTNRDMVKKDDNRVLGKPPGGPPQHTMSKAYYDKGHSAGGSKKQANSYHSGVYNRHQQSTYNRGIVEQKGKRANDLNSLLKKDKLTLLGVQLQEQEAKLFANHKENSFHLSKTTNNEFNIRQLPQTFDPNKFKAVNETSKFDWKSSSNGGSLQSMSLSNTRVNNQRTIAPLDDFDEELIAQLEQEFDGVPSVG